MPEAEDPRPDPTPNPPTPPASGGGAAAGEATPSLPARPHPPDRSDLAGPPAPMSVVGGSTSLDRPAVERVLARAAELQATGAEGSGQLTEAQLLEVGREAGLSSESLRQALAEERTRVALPEDHSWTSQTFGAAHASAARTMVGSPARAMETLDLWLTRDECLAVKRRFADRMTWEPRRDLWANLKRQFNPGGRGYALMGTHEVAATVVPVDADRVLVRLDADLGTTRRARLRLGGATAATGVLTGGALAVMGAMVVIPTAAAMAAVAAVAALPALAGMGGGYAIARHHRDTAVRVQLALEQILDRLEHEPPRTSIPPLLERLLR